MNLLELNEHRKELKRRLRSRERLFGGWVSFGHPSITEIFAKSDFDFIAIDMEHTTIDQAQAQRIMAASQSFGIPCLPRTVSHSNDIIKPLLDSGADGIIAPMVQNVQDAKNLVNNIKFPPVGNRSFGVSRAHGYGFDFEQYIASWNDCSSFIAQIESKSGVESIDDILSLPEVDGVMIGPYDLSGSLGVPGQIDHPDVRNSAKRVLEACLRHGKACGTQIVDVNSDSIEKAFSDGYTFIVFSSDLFVLWKWGESMKELIYKFSI